MVWFSDWFLLNTFHKSIASKSCYNILLITWVWKIMPWLSLSYWWIYPRIFKKIFAHSFLLKLTFLLKLSIDLTYCLCWSLWLWYTDVQFVKHKILGGYYCIDCAVFSNYIRQCISFPLMHSKFCLMYVWSR